MARLSAEAPFIHPDCQIVNSSFGAYCEIGRGSRILNTTLGDYSYCDRHADIANATIGKFSNIGAMSRIGAGEGLIRRRVRPCWCHPTGDRVTFRTCGP